MINVDNVSKTFDTTVAVNKVSFKAHRGQIFGLLGPNGAGKTTTLRMMYGLIKPCKGRITIDDLDMQSHTLTLQKKLGALPDGGGLYTRLTGRENIEYFGKLHGLSKLQLKQNLDELTERLYIGDILKRKTAGFSQGERMKISLARALIHQPDYVFLDEPTNGLDVLTTRAVRELLLDLKAQNKCIIFSSHLMHEVNNLCDHIAIISHSNLIFSGSIDDCIKQTHAPNFEDAFVKLAYSGQTTENPTPV